MLRNFFQKIKGRPNQVPNIVMILLDQFRNDARAIHPVFAEAGKKGVLFSKTITYAPYTLASIHATFTGMYGRYNGVDAYTKSDQYKRDECYTLPQYLKDIGYFTRGYTFNKILLPDAGFDKLNVVTEEEEKDILSSHVSELDTCFGQDKPFFCYLHYGEIHHQVVREVIRKFGDFDDEYFGNVEINLERYYRYAAQAGDHTAKLIEHIRQNDPDGNTMIIILTDHGAGVGEKPGEKAYGIYTYDYSICTWVYFLYPKALPAGKEINVQIRTIDILPTIMDILSIKPSRKHNKVMGRSLLPIIRGEESEHRGAFSETGGVEGPYPSPDKSNIKCFRDGQWKLIFNSTNNKFELYDTVSDPYETNNLYNSQQEKAQELWLKMSEYL